MAWTIAARASGPCSCGRLARPGIADRFCEMLPGRTTGGAGKRQGRMVWHKTIGSGPTKVVVIHGWFWDHRVFAPVFDYLDADNFTYAFIDIRGYGHSRNVSGDYSIGEVASDV